MKTIKLMFMNNKGKIYRSSKGDGVAFTCIDNRILQSKEMTSDEICLLVHLISLPLEWSIVKGHFDKRMKMGRDKLKKAWKGLEEKGFIVKEQMKNGNLISGYFYTVYENPMLDNPKFGLTETQSIDNPVIKESNKEENNIIIESNNTNNTLIYTGEEKQKVDISYQFNFSNNKEESNINIESNNASINTGDENQLDDISNLNFTDNREEIIKILNQDMTNIMSVMPMYQQHIPKRIITYGWDFIYENDVNILMTYRDKYLEKIKSQQVNLR